MPYEKDYVAVWYPQKGDRVRLNISPECPVDHWSFSGLLGTVEQVYDAADDIPDDWGESDPLEREQSLAAQRAYRGHFYWVAFDTKQPCPRTPYPIVGDIFAAQELEPA